MRKTLLVFLTVLLIAPMLSGCFYYPYRDDGRGRGYGQVGEITRTGDTIDPRDGNRDYRDRR